MDPEHDLVQLQVPGLTATPVTIRPSTTLRTGERVYAIGAPEGLELSLSEGLISSLRPYEKVMVIQTTAPISSGSSGGGLFDVQGRLVGITTFQVKQVQNLNFALPGEWIVTLPTRPASSISAQGGAPGGDDAVGWLYMADDAAEAGDWAKAAQAYQEVLRLRPDLAIAWYNLGVAYTKQIKHMQAISALREALRLERDNAEAWDALGYAYSRSDQHEQALSAYQEALRLKPDLARTWQGLAGEHLSRGQYAQAISAYREALRLKPDDEMTWMMLGVAYISDSQHAQAIPPLREAVRLKLDKAPAWYLLGEVYARQGDLAKVMEAYQRLKALDGLLADQFFRKFVLP
jgi:tetratricopeptide (TPR) repeat protein